MSDIISVGDDGVATAGDYGTATAGWCGKATAGWRGNRASWIAIAGWVSFIINYFGVNIFATGLHSYSGM